MELGDSFFGLLAVGAGLVPVVVYFLLIGAAVRALTPREVELPGGLAVTCSIGMGLSALIVTIGYVLFHVITAVAWAVGVLALALLVVAVARGRRFALRELVDPADLVAGLGVLLTLAPVLKYGNRFWTRGTHDLPHYMASVQEWLSRAGEGPDWAARHNDLWGAWMGDRAEFEKPVVTGLMVTVQQVGRLLAEEQTSALMVLGLAGLFGGMTIVVRELCGLSTLWAGVCVLPAGLSLVVLGRVFHAQAGQVVVVGLVAVLLALIPSLFRARPGRQTLGVAILIGLIAAAVLGSNATLVVGALPVIGALIVLAAVPVEPRLPVLIGRLGLVALVIGLANLPMISWYAHSVRLQSQGKSGYPIAFPTVLALVGVDPQRPIGEPGPALVSWVLLVLVLAAAAVRWRRQLGVLRILVVAMIPVNAALFIALYGPEAYNTGKWVALVIPWLGPLLLGFLLTLRRPVLRTATRVAAVACLVVAAVQGFHSGSTMPVALSTDLYALRDSPELKAVDTLNIEFAGGDPTFISDAAVAALLVPSGRVAVLTAYPEIQQPPLGHMFLTDLTRPQVGEVVSSVPLNDRYALQEIRAPMQWGPNVIGSDNPLIGSYLYGAWHPPEPQAAWTGALQPVWLVFDPPDGAQNLKVTLSGSRLVEATARRVEIRSGQRVVARHVFESSEPVDLTFDLTREDLHDGRAVLTIQAPTPEVTAGDPRVLGYRLTSVTLEPK